MSSAEFAEWAAFYQLEPFGVWRDNVHAALIAMAIARSLGATRVQVEDFILREAAPTKPKTPEEIYGALRAWAIGVGAGQ